jgi:hypothetical protein
VKWGNGSIGEVFGGLTDCAAVNVSKDKFTHAGPPELALDEVKSFDTAWVSGYSGVVTEGGDVSAEIGVMRDVHFLS